MWWSHVAMCPGWHNGQDQGRAPMQGHFHPGSGWHSTGAFTHAQQVARDNTTTATGAIWTQIFLLIKLTTLDFCWKLTIIKFRTLNNWWLYIRFWWKMFNTINLVMINVTIILSSNSVVRCCVQVLEAVVHCSLTGEWLTTDLRSWAPLPTHRPL